MQRKVIYAIILMVAFSLTGCAGAYKPQAGPVWMKGLLEDTPPGPEMFRLGWRDGCETGISATGNHWHKLHYTFTQRHDLVDNHEYYTGWKIAWSFCQRYMFQFFMRDNLGL